jgi:predicted membrane-bound spermidine synthase
MTSNRSALIFALFFLSGATTLVFEIVWLRGFAIVLGNTLYAMSCVLTAFTLGLAFGSVLANRYVRRFSSRPAGFFIISYGVLEMLIGVSGLLLTLALFRGQSELLEIIAGTADTSLAITLASHFSVSILLMGIPTACMGATLPILCMGLDRHADTSALYSFNTFGAAAGSLIASFVLIYRYGCIRSAIFVATLNAAVCAAAIVTSFRAAPGAARYTSARSGADAEKPPVAGSPDAWSPAAFLWLSLFSGYVFFSYELLWNRFLGLILGNRVYVTSVTLFLVLFCLGLGARLSRFFRDRVGPRNLLFACYAVAVVSLLTAALTHTAVLLPPTSPVAAWAFVSLLIVIPATAMGVVLPLLLTLPARGVVRGVHVAKLYTANLIGSVMGSVLTGYVLTGWLGSGRLLLLNSAVLLGALWVFARPTNGWGHRATAGMIALSLFLGAVFVLRWSDPVSVVPPEGRLVLQEDQHGIFTIRELEGGFLSVRNNATELVYDYGRPSTQYVQESQAHLPMLVASRYRSVAVIGSGYGITAGTFGQYPVERVDAVEILPLMVANGDYFARGAYDYLRNPKIETHVAEGRHFLASAPEPYDIISINVSDPYLPGSSSLFSTEFYRLVKSKLNPGGIVCQHVFGPDIVSLYHGFRAHFEHVRAIPAYRNGISILGSDAPIELRNPSLIREVPLPPVLLRRSGSQIENVERLLAIGDQQIVELEKREPEFVNSDDFPYLEFRRSDAVGLFFTNQ